MIEQLKTNIESHGVNYQPMILAFIMAVMFYFTSSLMNFAEAAQDVKVKDGESVKVTISSRDVTRVAFTGENRIQKIWATEGFLEITPDLKTGEAYIVPLAGSPAAFSFFVQDTNGATYTLVAQQADVPSETIMMQASRRHIARTNHQNRSLRNNTYIKNVKALMKAMATGMAIDGYTVDDVDIEVPLWKETHIHLKAIYDGYDLVGEVYVITNISDEDMVLAEHEFLDFGENTKATALERRHLAKGESTFIYVVRMPEGV